MKQSIVLITALSILMVLSSNTYNKFKKPHYPTTQQDTIKADTLTDSLSIEKGFYNYKLYKKRVQASYYANKFNGKKTASGARFNNNKLTAAHRKLAFGTKLRITNPRTKKSVIVTVNDRGPFTKGREIDLSKKAFMQIAPHKGAGHMLVNIEIVIGK